MQGGNKAATAEEGDERAGATANTDVKAEGSSTSTSTSTSSFSKGKSDHSGREIKARELVELIYSTPIPMPNTTHLGSRRQLPLMPRASLVLLLVWYSYSYSASVCSIHNARCTHLHATCTCARRFFLLL